MVPNPLVEWSRVRMEGEERFGAIYRNVPPETLALLTDILLRAMAMAQPGEQVDQRVVELLVAVAERQGGGKGGGRKEKSAELQQLVAELQQLVEACAAAPRVKAACRKV